MESGRDTALIEWLSSPDNPPVRYLTARDLLVPRPSADRLGALRAAVLEWVPLRQVLALQRADGSFPPTQNASEARPTFWALCLMGRCGLDITDQPVRRTVDYLATHHFSAGALSYTAGGSGVLPCYLGVITATLIKLGGLDSELDWARPSVPPAAGCPSAEGAVVGQASSQRGAPE
jgi:hypothetical protein